jgi:uncharacterized protein
MSELTKIWHYNRPKLAQKLVARAQALERVAPFGPRQTGKTSLLREEVMPLAEAKGMLAIYIECWADKADPLESINYALQKALDRLNVPAAGVGRTLKTIVKKVGIASASIELGEEPKRSLPASKFLQVDALLTSILNETKQNVLLVFDEFQALASAEEGDQATAALRSTLTQASKRVGAIFSGSSEVLLLQTFSRTKAPLYGFANPEAYPLLDEGFVAHVAQKFKAATGRELVMVEAMNIFDRLGRQPEPFLQAVSNAMANPKWGLESGLRAMLDPKAKNKWTINWYSLTDVQRVALRLVFENRTTTSKTSLDWVAVQLGQPKAQASTISRALEALAEKGLIERRQLDGKKGYRVSDPVMAAWLTENKRMLGTND